MLDGNNTIIVMESRYYTDDKNTLILLALLKEHGIRKVIASPGTTNIALVASMQYDEWFQVYSSVDERSAAYMACGIATEFGEPVILSCTGATASRNYFPGLTEAYYRKLPILVITGSHGEDIIGHLHAQTLDRTIAPKDTIKYSTSVKLSDSDWKVTIEVNKAILELTRNGGGPAHISLESAAYGSFTTKQLPHVRCIKRYNYSDTFPSFAKKKIAIFIGSHKTFSERETAALEAFCECNNSVIFADHTSGYYGKYRVLYALVASQKNHYTDLLRPDILIHIGEISGEFYCTHSFQSKETWRVSEDGEIRDLFSNLTNIFDVNEEFFFKAYTDNNTRLSSSYYEDCDKLYQEVYKNIPELPFGNIWIAKQLHDKLPHESILQLSIFNSLRSWNFFELPKNIMTRCNVGGFGIDGALSTLLGASLTQPNKLHFGIVGDLAFFYDINCLGNRHLNNNVRILLINNGKGTEFKNYDHPGSKWGDKADLYIAAGGHFGKQSKDLVKHYATDLGFYYITAQSKAEFLEQIKIFLSSENSSQPIIFEVFTNSVMESLALKSIRSILVDNRSILQKINSISRATIKKLISI